MITESDWNTIIKSKNFLRLFPIAILLLNFILKAFYLTSQDISIDEPFSIYHAQFGMKDMINFLQFHNNPPLFEIVLHFWIKCFGISPFSVRFFPLIFACLCPLALYYLAKEHFSTLGAISSSLLLTFSDLLMYYAHDCRVYSLFLLLTLLSMHFYLRILNCAFQKRDSVFFIFINALLIYCHYFGFFVLFIQAIHFLLFYRKNLFKFLSIYGLTLLFYLPQIVLLLSRFTKSVKAGWIKPPDGIDDLYNMLWIFSNFPFITVAIIIILVLALIKLILNKQKIELQSNTALVLLWFLIPFFGMFLISYWVPMYIGRYLIYALPAYYLLLLVCIQYLFKSLKWQLILMLGFILSMLFTHQLNPDKKQPIHATIHLLKKIKTNNSILVVSPYNFLTVFAYHYNRAHYTQVREGNEYKLIDSLFSNENIFVVNSPEAFQTKHKIKNEKVIYFYAGSNMNEESNSLKRYFDNHLTLVNETKTGPCFFISVYCPKN